MALLLILKDENVFLLKIVAWSFLMIWTIKKQLTVVLFCYFLFSGPLSWLDGSDVSYSNWLHEPWLNASCSYIRRDSGFQWETTTNCSQELFFICEFGWSLSLYKKYLFDLVWLVIVGIWCFLESGRSLACTDHNATLQCGSGQVIEIDDSFYGRKTVHYCRSSHAPSHAIPQQEECSWVDIVDTVSGTSSATFPLSL